MADYSQAELRVLASCVEKFYGDSSMADAYRAGKDIHRVVASKVFNKPEEEILDAERRFSKTISFSLTYGSSEASVAESTGRTPQEVHDLFKMYYSSFPGVQSFIDAMHAYATKYGCVRTPTGRIRHIPAALDPNNRGAYSTAMRQAQNCHLLDERVYRCLDGKDYTLRELIDSNDTHYIMSYDINSNKYVPTKIEHPRVTGYVNTLMEVTLDNGEVLKTTLNHPYLLKSGEYKEACELQIGDSIQPYYRIIDSKGYYRTEITDGVSNSGKTLHSIVFESLGYGFDKEYDGPTCIHHIDMYKSNNNPENLVLLPFWIHKSVHSLIGTPRIYNDVEYRDYVRGRLIEHLTTVYNDEHVVNIVERVFRCVDNDTLDKESMMNRYENQIKSVSSTIKERYKSTGNVLGMNPREYKMLQVGKPKSEYQKLRLKEGHNKPESIIAHSEASVIREYSPEYIINRCHKFIKYFKENELDYSTPSSWDSSMSSYNPSSSRRYSDYILKHFSNWGDFMNTISTKYNHKVIGLKVLRLDEEVPVGDIYIPNYENYSTCQGIFMHNSPIQGGASDIAVNAVVIFDEESNKRGMDSKVVGTVHDSIYVDIAPGELFESMDLLHYAMKTYPESHFDFLTCPLGVDLELSDNLGDHAAVKEQILNDDGSRVLTLKGYDYVVNNIVDALKVSYDIEDELIKEEPFDTGDASLIARRVINLAHDGKFTMHTRKITVKPRK